MHFEIIGLVDNWIIVLLITAMTFAHSYSFMKYLRVAWSVSLSFHYSNCYNARNYMWNLICCFENSESFSIYILFFLHSDLNDLYIIKYLNIWVIKKTGKVEEWELYIIYRNILFYIYLYIFYIWYSLIYTTCFQI